MGPNPNLEVDFELVLHSVHHTEKLFQTAQVFFIFIKIFD